MEDAFVFDRKADITVHEIKAGVFFENDDFSLEAFELQHGITTLGYRFVEKDKRRIEVAKIKELGIPEGPSLGQLQQGKTIEWKGKKIKADDVTYIKAGKHIGIICDTAPCNGCYKIAQNVDLLISEATYSSVLEEKSEAYNHMTAKQAALIASQSNAKRLVLTHLSARYKNKSEIQEDALNYFENVEVADDFLKISL